MPDQLDVRFRKVKSNWKLRYQNNPGWVPVHVTLADLRASKPVELPENDKFNLRGVAKKLGISYQVLKYHLPVSGIEPYQITKTNRKFYHSSQLPAIAEYVRQHKKSTSPAGYKHCGKCKETKPLSEFYSKVTGYCKPCYRDFKKSMLDSKDPGRITRRENKVSGSIITCLYCGKEVKLDNHVKRFCNNSCAMFYTYQQKHGVDASSKVCTWCNELKPRTAFQLRYKAHPEKGIMAVCKHCQGTKAYRNRNSKAKELQHGTR